MFCWETLALAFMKIHEDIHIRSTEAPLCWLTSRCQEVLCPCLKGSKSRPIHRRCLHESNYFWHIPQSLQWIRDPDHLEAVLMLWAHTETILINISLFCNETINAISLNHNHLVLFKLWLLVLRVGDFRPDSSFNANYVNSTLTLESNLCRGMSSTAWSDSTLGTAVWQVREPKG